ncbi:MAG: bifunctional 2-polyprenyl-6-hydroxyphenol methylase/3-demethylubiquinol 3-O-methyltransferase UbiG [Pseudomonadota bacterium]
MTDVDAEGTIDHGAEPSGRPVNTSSVDPKEVAQFDRLAAEWWRKDGPVAPLHAMQPVRMRAMMSHVRGHFSRPIGGGALQGLRILDVGCGGGLMAEPLARLGAAVTAIDASAENIAIAKQHAVSSGLDIDYRATTLEDLVVETEPFDLVTCLEVVEHVPDPLEFVGSLAAAVAPDGLLVMSTLNRTAQSWAAAIAAAEYVLRWLPPGTHQWRRFVPPDDLARMLEAAGLRPLDRFGLVYRPAQRDWVISPADLSINYMMIAEKAADDEPFAEIMDNPVR